MKVKVNKLPKSEVEIEGELEADIFESYFEQALSKLAEHLEVDGFRKGKAPRNILLSKIPEVRILEEMAELALGEHYPKIIADEKIDAINRPEVAITKLARKNPLGFKIKTAVLPTVKLPKYKNIANKIISKLTDKDKDTTVTDEDVENTITDIRKSRAPKKHVSDIKDPVSDTEELPEFNDEFVKGLGPFKDVADFKAKLKENLKLEKGHQVKEKTRLQIVEGILKESEVDLPDILVEIELDKILYRMESDIAQMGLKFEDYLKHLNKTKEDLRKEFRNEGEKKAKLALVLNEIAKLENIVADSKQVEAEVATILQQYKEADPTRARVYAENVLTNEKILQFLENQQKTS